jgi:hypothetical protein
MIDKNKLVVHCGGKVVALNDLQAYEIPEATRSYNPIGHYELAEYIKKTATDLIGAPPVRESYAVTKDGARMFGIQVFGKDLVLCTECKGMGRLGGENCPFCEGTGWMTGDEYGFAIAHRNSYDKSMSVGVAMGHSVFVCDNLAINGEIKILRKHTRNCWEDIDQHLLHSLVRKRPQLQEQFAEDVDFMKTQPMSVEDGYRLIGLLMGRKILVATQAGVALHQWNDLPLERPTAPHTGWQFYNSCTQALKSSPPHQVMERHRALHETVRVELS